MSIRKQQRYVLDYGMANIMRELKEEHRDLYVSGSTYYSSGDEDKQADFHQKFQGGFLQSERKLFIMLLIAIIEKAVSVIEI
jgi:hypothetical protein